VKTLEIKKLASQFTGSIKWSEEDQVYVGRCPELFQGGCHGETRAEAKANLREAIRLAVQWHLEDGKRLPSPMKRHGRFASALSARKKIGVSQKVFAEAIGVKVGTLQNWEQGRSKPPGPARLVLKLAEDHPEVFREVAAKDDD
jgi:DNA-binding transcriptional regulator YiaG